MRCCDVCATLSDWGIATRKLDENTATNPDTDKPRQTQTDPGEGALRETSWDDSNGTTFTSESFSRRSYPELLTVPLESIQTPWLFPHFVKLQPYINVIFHFSFFFFVCRLIRGKNNLILFRISIQTLYLVLCCSTFGSNYSLESSWVWRYKLGTPVSREFLPLFSADPLKLIAAQLFSGLSRDVRSGSSPGTGSATQRDSETCPEATPALSWLCT